MIESGEDPLFIIRRLVIFAAEDIGLADPNALSVAVACQQAVHFVGMPEGFLPMSECVLYLALAPKSNSSYTAYNARAGGCREDSTPSRSPCTCEMRRPGSCGTWATGPATGTPTTKRGTTPEASVTCQKNWASGSITSQATLESKRSSTPHFAAEAVPRRKKLSKIEIEFLYAKGSEKGEAAEEALRMAIEATAAEANVTYTEVESGEDAKVKKFLGTPSIRVNGIDVEYGDRPPEEYQMGTRYYNTPDGWKPHPHARLIANTILEFQDEGDSD